MAFRSAHRPPGIVVVAASDTPDAKRRGAQYRCDGVADQVEVQAAIDSIPDGGKVLLLEGTYNLTATVNLIADLILEGEGRATVVSKSGNSPAIQATNVAGVIVRDLLVDGPGTAQTSGHGVVLSGVTDGAVEGVEVTDCRDGIRLTGSSARCRVTRCRVRVCNVGIRAGDTNDTGADLAVVDNLVGLGAGNAPTSEGISTRVPRTQIMNNRLLNCTGIAIQVIAGLPGANDCAVVGNFIRGDGAGNPADGIRVAPDRVLVQGNTVLQVGVGLRFTGGARCVVVGNLFDLSWNSAIVTAGGYHLIVGNHILRSGQQTHNTFAAVRVQGTKESIQANAIKHAGEAVQAIYGISIEGAVDAFVTDNDLRESGFTASLNNAGVGTVTISANQI